MPPLCQPYPLFALIKKCSTTTSLQEARQLHALLLTTATTITYHAQSAYLQNNLISMYGRCCSTRDAQLVFDNLTYRNVVSYNALLTMLSKDRRLCFSSFAIFSVMMTEGTRPSGFTLASLIQTSRSLDDPISGSWLHAKAIRFGLMSDICVQTSLLGLYSHCEDMESSERVFYDMKERDDVSWNCMLLGYLKNGRMRKVLRVFAEMVSCGSIVPTPVTYSIALRACGTLLCGRIIHGQIIVSNVLVDLPLHNALLDMYCDCDDMRGAFSVFLGLKNPDIVSWNTVISGCSRSREGLKAMNLFVRLLRLSFLKPDVYTFSAIIDAISELPAAHYGMPLHAQVVKVGLDDSVYVGTTLLTMYFENDDAESAQLVFDLTKEKDVVLWTEMIMKHSELGKVDHALRLFGTMYREGYRCDSFALSGALSACADLAMIKQGEIIHSISIKSGCDSEMSVCGSLIHMYSKNGKVQSAKSIFSRVINPDVMCYNAMLGCYSHNGLVEDVIKQFKEILRHGHKPDNVTFLSLLSACSHTGLVEKGRFFWVFMKKMGITPGPKHYSCMVSLLGRAGLLDETKQVITELRDNEERLVLWRALLSYSVNKQSLELGLHAASQVLRLVPDDAATLILLSNLYAATGKWELVAETRKKMRGMMLEKHAGLSWIESKTDVLVFSSGENSCNDETQGQLSLLQKYMVEPVADELYAMV